MLQLQDTTTSNGRSDVCTRIIYWVVTSWQRILRLSLMSLQIIPKRRRWNRVFRVSLGKKSCLWSRHTRIETEPLLKCVHVSISTCWHGIVILICVDRFSAFGKKYSRRHIVLNPQREEGESFSNCRFSKDFQSRHCGLPTFFIKNRGFSVARGSC